MFTEMTLSQLQATKATPERARYLGELGYLQWLATLPSDADYECEAVRAWLCAQDESPDHPAVAVFCELIRDTLRYPAHPLSLGYMTPKRRGGARNRRAGQL